MLFVDVDVVCFTGAVAVAGLLLYLWLLHTVILIGNDFFFLVDAFFAAEVDSFHSSSYK